MRKRLIITNAIMVFMSLIILLIISIFVISNFNDKKVRNDLETFLQIAKVNYDGTNGEKVIQSFSSSKVRLSIISLDGAVLYDTYEKEYDSHLDREEIKQLGTFVRRYSSSLNKTMLYLAIKDNNSYLRVSMSIDDINPIINSYVNISLVSLFAILLVSTLLMWPINKKELEPLVDVTNRLNRLTNQPSLSSLSSIDDMYKEIDHVGEVINEQLLEINFEKEKINSIINHLQQGLMVINENRNIEIINEYAIKMFNVKIEHQNNNYIYTIRDMEFQQAIEDAFCNKITECNTTIKNSIYHTTFHFFDDKMIINLYDVTNEVIMQDMKKEFFQNASHELKSPLTSILGYQQMIEKGIITSQEEILEANKKTIKEAQRMKQIIIEMLELSELEADINYELNDINVLNVVNDVLYLFEPKIEEKKIIVDKDLHDIVLKGNPEHLYMLVKNIIENAIKYNKENGSIKIILEENKFVVEDSGIGIDEQNINRIFERFYRVDKVKSKELGGTGLGLAIVKHICQTYNYRIEVQSVLNVGTKFNIYFR